MKRYTRLDSTVWCDACGGIHELWPDGSTQECIEEVDEALRVVGPPECKPSWRGVYTLEDVA